MMMPEDDKNNKCLLVEPLTKKAEEGRKRESRGRGGVAEAVERGEVCSDAPARTSHIVTSGGGYLRLAACVRVVGGVGGE